MNHSKISIRYAKALYSFAKEKSILENVKTDILLIVKAINTITELSDFVKSPVAKPSEKKLFFKNLFDKKISTETLHFLNLLIDNKREMFLVDIARNFLEIFKKEKGIKTLILTGSQALTEDQKKNIVLFAENNFKTKIELEEKIDPSIIGGFIIRIDDMQLDASISWKLKELKRELLETAI
ncbi:MAG: ATP synthase F1 subunit delta [Bacteroidales bacterium]|nr:ATP synthase F1 subunit delta [Bacteroidales bacterium]